jgi:iron complex transport system substrate-binding protein
MNSCHSRTVGRALARLLRGGPLPAILSISCGAARATRGEAMIADMDASLARPATGAHDPPLNAIVLRPNGFTAGKESLVNELLQRAGLVNLAPSNADPDSPSWALNCQGQVGWMVLQERIELSTSPLPRECSTTELLQHPGSARRMSGRLVP